MKSRVFQNSPGEVFRESRGHQRNTIQETCELQIAAVQGVNGYLKFDYAAGDEVTGVYMQKVFRMEWNKLGEAACGDVEHWAEFTFKIHRRFDDSGNPYEIDLNTSCGHAYTSTMNAAGSYDTVYNPDIYLEDKNDDGTPNPGNWGLNPNQGCIVWFGGGPHTDSRIETRPGYGVVGVDATRCGEGGATTNSTTGDGITTLGQIIYNDEGGAYDGLPTSSYLETLTDWYPKEEAVTPGGDSWKETAFELLSKRPFTRWLFTDINDDTAKVFGCGLSDTQRITLYWKRGATNEIGAIAGGIPGITPSWGIATQLELVDWEGGAAIDPGTGSASYISSSVGASPPAGIWCKKSRLENEDCETFIEQIYVGGNTGGHSAAVCVNAGPIAGFHDFIPDFTVFGYTDTVTCSPPC